LPHLTQMVMRWIVSFCVLASALAAPVVVTGATGHTGLLVFKLLKSQGVEVRGLVRNATKAKDVLGCTKCDESEGIFEGDVTKPESMAKIMDGAGALVILTSAAPTCNPYPKCTYSKGAFPIDIDWLGGKNQIEQFIKGAGGLKPIVLVSAAGTTEPDTDLDKMGPDGQIGFYKLNLESFLMSSRAPYTIVKPCGLGEGAPAQDELLVGHDDGEGWDLSIPIQRSDVARVVVAAATSTVGAGLRFDICAKAGTPTTDAALPALFKAAKFPWQQQKVVV